MLRNLYLDLAWLPAAPDDFRTRCRAALESPRPGSALQALATFALNESQLLQLAKAKAACKAAQASLAPLTPVTLGLLGNATLAPVVPVLQATALRHGLDLQIVKADYGQMMQEALLPDSSLNQAKPDAVLLAIDYRGLPSLLSDGEGAASQQVDEAFAFIENLRMGFRQNSGSICLLQTLPPPLDPLFGSADRFLDAAPRWKCEQLNQRLAASVRESTDLLVDVAAIAETVGLEQWYSPTQWNIAKFAFDSRFLPLYADHVCRVLAASRGKSRRCLILDLDNTVWGGVIGDDGMDGILLGQGDATGEAFLEVQRVALQLRARGIVLAVSSKNTDEVARRVFREHPDMLLREDHIAVFQANWNDKAGNIRAIAETLSLGLDAMVFLDDNPVERGLVRELIPQVAVPEIGDDPAYYARTLLAAGYFEATTFSAEDRQRAGFYQNNARRVALQGQSGGLEAYLASLKMEISFSPFDAVGRSRIVQLINKSNQFNLTTRRYTEDDVQKLEADPSVLTLQVRLTDSFGDNGMISVIVCRPQGSYAWEIDTWLMSCRVLGRCVEQAVLAEIMHHARMRNVKKLIGVYIPTDRNAMVQEHYAKLGFTKLSGGDENEARWTCAVGDTPPELPMVVLRSGFDTEPYQLASIG